MVLVFMLIVKHLFVEVFVFSFLKLYIYWGESPLDESSVRALGTNLLGYDNSNETRRLK